MSEHGSRRRRWSREPTLCAGQEELCLERSGSSPEIAPRASVAPFIEAMPTKDVRLIEYPGETGVGLQHLGILAGRQAYARVWPEIISWLSARRAGATQDF